MIKRVKYMLLIYLTGIVLLEAVTNSAATANEQRITQFTKYIEYMVDKHCISNTLDSFKRYTRNTVRGKANLERHSIILKITRAGMVTITHEIVLKNSLNTAISKTDFKFQLTDVHEITVIQPKDNESIFPDLYLIELRCKGEEKLMMETGTLTLTGYNPLGDTAEKKDFTPEIPYIGTYGTHYFLTKDKLAAEKIARAFRGLKTLLSKYK